MKRNWDLIRKQLIDVEEENDIMADFPLEPKWADQSEEEFSEQFAKYRAEESKLAGHHELLIESGYVDGFSVIRSADNW